MTTIGMDRYVMTLEVTMVLCSFMIGLTIAPWVDKLRHLDAWQRKKRPRDGSPEKAHGKKLHIQYGTRKEKSQMNHDPFGVIASDRYTYPPENESHYHVNIDCAELFTIRLPVRAEEDIQVDFTGECQCDKCRSGEYEPVELYRGMSVVRLDGKEIYIGCLEEYLQSRMVVIGR